MGYVQLSDEARIALGALILRYDLHADPYSPVPIRQVARDEGWYVRWSETMEGVYGIAVVCEGIKVMTINATVCRGYQRWAMAHEMGHVLCGHGGKHPSMMAPLAMQLHKLADWVSVREEHQANMAAATILIPDVLFHEGYSEEEIAANCDVPVSLVKYRAQALKGIG